MSSDAIPHDNHQHRKDTALTTSHTEDQPVLIRQEKEADCGHDREDTSYRSEEDEIYIGERNENTNAENDQTGTNLLMTVARWLKISPNTEDNAQNQPSASQPISAKGDHDTGLSVKDSTGQGVVSTRQQDGNDPTENNDVGFIMKKWWLGAIFGQDEEDIEENTPHHELESITSHISGAESLELDETSVELMASALDWLHTSQTEEDHGSVGSGYASLGDRSLERLNSPSSRTQTQRAIDLKKVVQWMKKGKGKGQRREDKYDPTKEYRKLDGMLPKRRGMTPEDRAAEIEGSLDWLLNLEGMPPLSVEENTKSLATIDWSSLGPAPICITSPEDRLKELENVLMWIRNKGKGLGNKYDPYGNFRKLDKLLPKKRGRNLEDRGREIEGVLDWMRNSDLMPKETNTIPELSDLERYHVSRRTPEKRAKDLKDVIMWMSEGSGPTDKGMDPAGHFSRLDLILEVKEDQSSEKRARDIECALDWLLDNDFDGSTPARGGRHSRSHRRNPQRERPSPSPRAQHQKLSHGARIPKLIGVPRDVEPILFASIGRVVNIVAPSSDISTIESTQLQKDVLVDKAQQYVAIATPVEQESQSREEKSSDTDLFGNGNIHWWETWILILLQLEKPLNCVD